MATPSWKFIPGLTYRASYVLVGVKDGHRAEGMELPQMVVER